MDKNRNYNIALIALGGNLPTHRDSPKDILVKAASEIAGELGRNSRLSRPYATPCFPPGSGPDFVNAAMRIETELTADDLLDALHRIEAKAGRARRARWAARTLDLDLLAYGDQVRPDRATFAAWAGLDAEAQQARAPSFLLLPHPRMHERAFVLVPLADVAPDWQHPVFGKSVRTLLDALPARDRAAIVPI